MSLYNSSDEDWVEFGLSLLTATASVALVAILRYLSEKVLRTDAERTIFDCCDGKKSQVIIGSYKVFTLLGAPHTLRTRTSLGFVALLGVIVGTIALSVSALAFSGSRVLRTGDKTVKATARQGLTTSSNMLSEDTIEKFSDWFRSSGVVSFCQRRNGKERIFYQPFVEQATDTKVFCGSRLDIKLNHESSESIEKVSPNQLRITPLNGVDVSTPHSNYAVHEININGKGYNAVCNTGEYYRGVRSGRVSQSCAFSTPNMLILGGYSTSRTNLSGPGVEPTLEDVQYYDSYNVVIDTELNEQQLMLALTLWDLGAMSEIEVAVLCRLSFEISSEPVPSFIGGYERLQIDYALLMVGLISWLLIILIFVIILAWDGFSRTQSERLFGNITDLSFLSKIWASEVAGKLGENLGGVGKNMLAIRDVTHRYLSDDETEAHSSTTASPEPRIYHLGSASLGSPISETDKAVIVAQLNRKASSDPKAPSALDFP